MSFFSNMFGSKPAQPTSQPLVQSSNQISDDTPIKPEDYAVLKSYILNSIAGWNKGLKAQTLYNQKFKGNTGSGAPRREKLIKAALNDVLIMPDLANYSATSATVNSSKSAYNSMFTPKAPSQGGKKTRKHRRKKH